MSSQPITPLTYRGPFFRDDTKEPLVLKRSISVGVVLVANFAVLGEFFLFFLDALLGFLGIQIPRIWVAAAGIAVLISALVVIGKSILEREDKPYLVLSREGITEACNGESIRFSRWEDFCRVDRSQLHSKLYEKPFYVDYSEVQPGSHPAKSFLIQQLSEIREKTVRLQPKAHYVKWAVVWAGIGMLFFAAFQYFAKSHPPSAIYLSPSSARALWLLEFSTLCVAFLLSMFKAIFYLSYLDFLIKKEAQPTKRVVKMSSSAVEVFVNVRKGYFSPRILRPNAWYRYLDEKVLWRLKYPTNELVGGVTGLFFASSILWIGETSTPVIDRGSALCLSLAGLASIFYIGKGVQIRQEFARTRGAQFRLLRAGGILIRLASGKDVHATILPHRPWPAGSPRYFGNRTIRLHCDDGRYYRYDPHFLVPILPGRVTVKF